MKKFHTFCAHYHMMDPFPGTEKLLCCFAAYMADKGLSVQTGKSYMAAVRNMQLSLGLPDPREQSSLPVLKRVQLGLKRARLGRGTPAKTRLPITAHLLSQIKGVLDTSTHPERVAMWAICCSAFFGFFRLGELLMVSPAEFNTAIHLAWGDVAVDSVDNPQMIQIHLKQSKTDQFGKGVDVVLGGTGTDLCPVAALLGYIMVRGAQPGPFFRDSDGKPLAKAVFVAELRKVLIALGLPAHQYAGHSFHIGAATTDCIILCDVLGYSCVHLPPTSKSTVLGGGGASAVQNGRYPWGGFTPDDIIVGALIHAPPPPPPPPPPQ